MLQFLVISAVTTSQAFTNPQIRSCAGILKFSRLKNSNAPFANQEIIPVEVNVGNDTIKIARLRQQIQDAVLREDYIEAAEVQTELKDLLQKATSQHFKDLTVVEVASPLVNVQARVPRITPLIGPNRVILSSEERERLDESNDSIFWAKSRMVIHCDMGFAVQLEALYRQHLLSGMEILDIGASCASFLPEIPFSRVVGLGMNFEEMMANEDLTERVVQDLNKSPQLPFADDSFDAVLCASSLHYLKRPEAVLAEMRRVMRPGGVVVVSFSDRCLPSKVVRAWGERGMLGRCDLVAECMAAAGGLTPPQRVARIPPLSWVSHLIPAARGLCGGDPFAALFAFKGAPPPGWAVRLCDPPDPAGGLRVLGGAQLTPFAAAWLAYLLLFH